MTTNNQLIYGQPKLEDLSLEDFIIRKVEGLYKEIDVLKSKYQIVTGKPFPGKEVEDDIVVQDGVAFPSKRQMIENVNRYIKDYPSVFFKTKDIYEHFHKDVRDKKIREELIRRYSNILRDKKQEGVIFSRRIEGERGDIFNTNEQMLIKQYGK